MQKARFFAGIFAVLSAALSMGQLNIGDKAPELKVTDWVKGTPVALGKGKPVVVEFWATWCGPCKVSIPHLSEMSKKLAGKVDFVGVSIWESKPEDYKTKVPSFVKAMGDKMAYTVATEGPNTHMANAWMKAAGENGIPSAFLVDGDGKIAWIGHPMEGLDKAIDDLLEGKLQYEEARQAREKAKAEEIEQGKKQAELQKKFDPVFEAYQKGKFAVGVALCDKLWDEEKDQRLMIANFRMMGMTQGKLGGFAELFAKIETLPEANNPEVLNQIIWSVIEKPGTMDAKGYKAAVKLGEKMMKLAPNDPMNMDTFALTLWRAGEKKKALAAQKKAVELAPKDSRVDAETLKEMKARLKEFGGK